MKTSRINRLEWSKRTRGLKTVYRLRRGEANLAIVAANTDGLWYAYSYSRPSGGAPPFNTARDATATPEEAKAKAEAWVRENDL